MFGLFKKKQLPKKLLLLSALPDNKDMFLKYAANGESDFLHSLQVLYGTDSADTLWDRYKSSATSLQLAYKEVRERGGDVISNFSLQDLSVINNYEIIIVIAHHSDNSDEIEIGGRLTRSLDFVNALPQDTKAIFDLTSCYSAHLIPKIKAHIPLSKIIGIEVKTKLAFRLFLLEKVIQYMAKHESLDYITSLREVLSSLPTNDESKMANDKIGVYLGGKMQSTVFAPQEAVIGEDFIVSVFLHRSDDIDEVEIIARDIDDNLEKRSTKSISFKIKRGDRVDVQLSTTKQLSTFFGIDKGCKGFVWDGDINNVEFIVSVLPHCSVSSFIGKIKVCINKEPVVDMIFKTAIVEAQYIRNHDCAVFEFEPFDKSAEMRDAGISLRENLLKRIELLNQQVLNDSDRRASEELTMCIKCKEILESFKKGSNQVLKVFISSTSDMRQFRQVVRERVEACEMYPDMYENWGQGNDYPRDMCCQHVLQSDIFVCILGAKYGFIEPIWDKSMTEIEYRIAINAGIPILIYIISNYKEEMEKLVDEEKRKAHRQEELIEEIKNKRMVGLFPNELGLSLLVNSELLTIKHKLQS